MKKSILFAIVFLFTLGLKSQVNEKIDRGIVALTVSEKAVLVSWRLLKDDPLNLAFNVYRKIFSAAFKKAFTQNWRNDCWPRSISALPKCNF